jgi:hypothetical protein
MAQPGRLAKPWKLETRNWKLEIKSWKLKTGNSKLAPTCNRKSAIYTPAKVREDGRKKKNFTNEATKLLKLKDRRTN